MRRIVTLFGYIWKDETGKQVAAQVGHHWNGETLSKHNPLTPQTYDERKSE